MAGSRNQTFDDRDSSLIYQGTWSQGIIASNITVTTTSDPNAIITFKFPIKAIAFYIYGFPGAPDNTFGICIDCPSGTSTTQFSPFHDFNAPVDEKTPAVLYLRNFSIPSIHEIAFNPHSQLSIDRFELAIDPSTPTQIPSPPALSSSLASSLSATTVLSVPSTPPQPTLPVPSTPPAPHAPAVPVAAIVGGVIGGFAAVLIGLAAYLWCRRRNRERQGDYVRPRRQNAWIVPTVHENKPRVKNAWREAPAVSTIQRRILKRRDGSIIHTEGEYLETVSIQIPGHLGRTLTNSGSGGVIPRREVDAGPVDGTEVEILPPEYEQVFTNHRVEEITPPSQSTGEYRVTKT
ncbi:hypothetical protein P691DRAFT_776455 [Macrolepiota fuliginosa MF-IS2]|uniref:Uncharacterized protein n=1 Tax=Macrolepiota fuliginosa MF-IS2 TaxID=1400762 RepID=A0A9P5X8X2_9AGAR|nr:hypothetical protein P691DRAFT_776455 [Macrolepiota fuliginosa MF-IS2]